MKDEMNMTHPYSDILNHSHYRSPRRAPMPRANRAAQFAPFAALTGYEDAVRETARQTVQKIELDENIKDQLDEKLRLIQDQLAMKPCITITYFQPDEKKSGGTYVDITGIVKKIDAYKHAIILLDKSSIPIDDILEISGDIFSNLDIDNR